MSMTANVRWGTRIKLLMGVAVVLSLAEVNGAFGGERAGRVFFLNQTKKPLKIECTSYIDAAGVTQTVSGVWEIPAEKGHFLMVNTRGNEKNLVARVFRYKVTDDYGTSGWTSDDGDFDRDGDMTLVWNSEIAGKHFASVLLTKLNDDSNSGGTRETRYRPAEGLVGQQRSGQVRIVNSSRYPIKISCMSYVDAAGRQNSTTSGVWEFAPGESAFLLDRTARISAQRFDLWLTIGKGQTAWFIAEEQISEDGALTLTVDENLVSRHFQKRAKGEGRPSPEAAQAAIGKLIGALIAQGVIQGNSKEDGLGNLIIGGLAVNAKENLLASAVSDLFPHFNASQASSARRVVSLVLDGRLTPANFQRAAERERFLAAVKRESPELAGFADFMSFLGDVQSAREQSKR